MNPVEPTSIQFLVPLLSALSSFVMNAKILSDCPDRWKERRPAAAATLELNNASTPAFSALTFRILLYGPMIAIYLAALLLVVGVLGFVAWYVFNPIASASVSPDRVKQIAVILVPLCIALLLIWNFEPHLQLRFLPRRLRPWEAERIAAKRVKRGLPAFVLDLDACEKLAQSLLGKVHDDPDWLFGTLLPENGDSASLANELLVGVALEHLQPDTFDASWSRFAQIQMVPDYRSSNYLLRPEQVRATTGPVLAAKLKDAFATFKLTLTARSTEEIANLADRLRRSYHGDVTTLLHVKMPRTLPAVVVGVTLIAVWITTGRDRLISLAAGGYAVSAEIVVPVVGVVLASLIALSWRQWVTFLLLKSRIWRISDCIDWRLRQLPIFWRASGTRTAFIKFASEYLLLKEDVDVRLFGQSSHVRQALFNSGALRTDSETFKAFDGDLTFFAQRALACIGGHIDRLLTEHPYVEWRASLQYAGAEDGKGQFLGLNIADGGMFLLGRDYCGQHSWTSPAGDCPAKGGGVCEVATGVRYALQSLEYKRDLRPEKTT